MTSFKLTAPERPGKIRLEDLLCEQFGTLSRMYLRSLIRDGKVEVNGRHENAGYRVRAYDFVEVDADTSRGTSMVGEDIPLDVVFEDSEIIIVNKPAGMLVHPSHREKKGTLLNALTHHLNKETSTAVLVRPGLIHRLDKDTSGLIVVAKTPVAHRILARHFMKKLVEKRYIALVEGLVDRDEGTIEAPIGRHPELKHWSIKHDGKHSETRFWVRDRRADATLIELEPVTGRTNQLRIHCELIGHPVVGDVKRGGRKFTRLCLHAERLALSHPTTSEIMRFESPCSFR